MYSEVEQATLLDMPGKDDYKVKSSPFESSYT